VKERGELVITESGAAASHKDDVDEAAVRAALAHTPYFLDQAVAAGADGDRIVQLLKTRPALARLKDRVERRVAVLPAGREAFTAAEVAVQKNMLSGDDITSGGWRSIELRPYDVTLEARAVRPAKIHPMRKILMEARTAFLEMGFTEMVSPMAELAFWNFDALFQPQDHPARDMQDTFYVARPESGELPPDDLVERVRRTHEDGWETGSRGWGYTWRPERAREIVLRTHTTATSIRSLADHPEPPLKTFCVGTVFRNEAISYKHLPEFFQVDGIIVDENASLASLLGTLREFYRKMGFDKVKFKPGFFPYTEPSAEVFIWMESRRQWLEMGGSGIFRPEVTRPLGCRYPVLAWGLGLDRLAMRRYGFDDIRELYWSDLDKIQEVPLCR
ncbi:phenylalanine--tRNA ligase subunit alpha, partial [bacterium]|nr:phenylalanine--tRNA ligase subunit alpha [candidate division CSSED10-310 bacterium]